MQERLHEPDTILLGQSARVFEEFLGKGFEGLPDCFFTLTWMFFLVSFCRLKLGVKAVRRNKGADSIIHYLHKAVLGHLVLFFIQSDDFGCAQFVTVCPCLDRCVEMFGRHTSYLEP